MLLLQQYRHTHIVVYQCNRAVVVAAFVALLRHVLRVAKFGTENFGLIFVSSFKNLQLEAFVFREKRHSKS